MEELVVCQLYDVELPGVLRVGDDLSHLQSELSLTQRRGTTRGQLVGAKAKLEVLRLGLPAVERCERREREKAAWSTLIGRGMSRLVLYGIKRL